MPSHPLAGSIHQAVPQVHDAVKEPHFVNKTLQDLGDHVCNTAVHVEGE